MKRPKIALFDLDGTLADYEGQLQCANFAHCKTLLDPDEEKALTDPVYDIAELAGRITKENRPDPEDVDFGEPVGKEKL
ncbi:MAG: hypothetical protein AB7U43_11885 [Desulfobacter sp.]